MRQGLKLVALALAGLALFGTAPAGGRIPSFSALPAGDTLQIDFKSDGCFHQDHFSFTYGRSPQPTMNVVEFRTTWVNDKPAGEDSKYLGSLALTPSDLKQLDRLMDYYRKPHGDGCTTVETITIKHVHGGRVVAEETFKDASCDASSLRYFHPEIPAYLSLHQLPQRLKHK